MKTEKKTQNPDDVVCVMALNKARLPVTSTSCDRKDAPRYARYYSSIGYYVKTMEYGEELDKFNAMVDRIRNTPMN